MNHDLMTCMSHGHMHGFLDMFHSQRAKIYLKDQFCHGFCIVLKRQYISNPRPAMSTTTWLNMFFEIWCVLSVTDFTQTILCNRLQTNHISKTKTCQVAVYVLVCGETWLTIVNCGFATMVCFLPHCTMDYRFHRHWQWQWMDKAATMISYHTLPW